MKHEWRVVQSESEHLAMTLNKAEEEGWEVFALIPAVNGGVVRAVLRKKVKGPPRKKSVKPSAPLPPD